MKEKIIIFDFDGVIVDSFAVAFETNKLARPTLTRERYRSKFNGNINDAQFEDEQVREIDPGSDLYPFMVAASGETCDISAVYTLLRRNPSLAHRNKPKRAKRKRKMK